MPARSTSKATSPEKKATKAAAKKPAAKKKPAAASKAKPSARKAPASKGKAAAPPKRSAKPGTITVGETQYVLGEYGQLMTMDEYELVMGKKLSG
jgi:hypothetical protein